MINMGYVWYTILRFQGVLCPTKPGYIYKDKSYIGSIKPVEAKAHAFETRPYHMRAARLARDAQGI